MTKEKSAASEQTDTEKQTRFPGVPSTDDATIPPAGLNSEDGTLPPQEFETTAAEAAMLHDQASPDATLPPRRSSTEATSGDRVRYFGDYELLEEIARGGMGVVYKARQINLNRLVALKMILAGQLAGNEDVQRFHTEAEAAAKLDHPGIVPIFEIGEHQGQHYFSMGFIEGVSLANEVANGPFDSHRAATLVRDTATAMAYAHKRGVVHRDLKPANILLDQTGRPRVTDFGLAKKTKEDSGLTETGQILGTPAYMPPEQAAGKVDDVGALADVYSLGAVLYCLLTGRPPFQAASPMDTLLQVLEREPIAPRTLVPQLPLDLETICLKCLEKDPQRRYQSAVALTEELDRFLSGQPIEARPISQVQRTWRWCKRKPALAAFCGLAVLVLLALGIGGPLVASQQSRLAHQARESQSLAERNAYAAQMLLAQRHWEEGNLEQLDQSLDLFQNQPDRTDIEFDYWQRIEQSDLATFDLHQHPATEVMFSDDDVIAASCSGSAAKIWETATGKVLLEYHFSPEKVAINTFRLSPDGKQFAIGFEDHTAEVWDVRTQQRLTTFRGHSDGVETIRFHPSGKWIASQSPSHVKIWDPGTGEELRSFPTDISYLDTLSFSPDGQLIATSTWAGLVKVWEWQESKAIMQQNVIRQGNESPWNLCLSPDGRRMAIAMSNQTIGIWDIRSGQHLQTLVGHANWVTSVAYSPDGKHLASAGDDNMIVLWDVATGKRARTFRGHRDKIFSLSFNSDGSRLLSAGRDTIKMWDVDQDQSAVELSGHRRSVLDVSFTSDGARLVSVGRDGLVKFWNTTQSTTDGSFGQCIRSFRGDSDQIATVAVSPDDRWTAWGGSSGQIRLWDARSERVERRLIGHRNDVSDVVFSPDGKWLASCGADRRVMIWDVESGEQISTLNGHTDQVSEIAFSPDGKRLASASWDQSIRIWDIETAKPVRILNGHEQQVSGVVFAPDGKVLASASWDGTGKLWDWESGTLIKTLSGHSEPVANITFSPNGKRIGTASWDGSIKIWDTETGGEVLSLRGHEDNCNAFAFAPDGRRMVSAGSDQMIRLWIATPWSDDQKTQQMGLAFLRSAYDTKILKPPVLRAIESTETLTEAQKDAVRTLASSFQEPTAEEMVRSAAEVAMGQYYFPTAYEKELRRCDAAAQMQHREITLSHVRGLLNYRLGRYQEAIEQCEEIRTKLGRQEREQLDANQLIRALAEWKLGNTQKAQSLFDQTLERRQQSNDRFDATDWYLDTERLLEEAKAVLQESRNLE